MLKAGAVSYLQQNAAEIVGVLAHGGVIEEGSPAHAALHAIIGCAGAAAGGANCSAGALGASASVVITTLLNATAGPLDPNDPQAAANAEARRNVVANLVAGMASAGGADATTAAAAALAEVDNNANACPARIQSACMSKPKVGQRDKLPPVETVIRDTQLDSPLERDLYENYVLRGGDYVLDKETFNAVARHAKFDPSKSEAVTFSDGTKGYKQTVNTYSDPALNLGIGIATIYFQNGVPVGLFDNYNFDAKPIGARSLTNEAATRATGILGGMNGAKPFNIKYGKTP